MCCLNGLLYPSSLLWLRSTSGHCIHITCSFPVISSFSFVWSLGLFFSKPDPLYYNCESIFFITIIDLQYNAKQAFSKACWSLLHGAYSQERINSLVFFCHQVTANSWQPHWVFQDKTHFTLVEVVCHCLCIAILALYGGFPSKYWPTQPIIMKYHFSVGKKQKTRNFKIASLGHEEEVCNTWVGACRWVMKLNLTFWGLFCWCADIESIHIIVLRDALE